MPDPATTRQSNRIFPSPLVADELFYELVEISRDNPPGVTPEDYGTLYSVMFPNTGDYANHKFSHIENVTADGLQQRWWFCAPREDQDTYSYALTYPYGGNPSYPRITRWFVVLRSEGDTPLPLGTADTGTQFTASEAYTEPLPSTDTYREPLPSTEVYTTPSVATSPAVLVAQSTEPIPVESHIGSLFVKVTRIFDVIPGSDDSTNGSGAGQTQSGYHVVRPYGTNDYFELTWKLVLPRSVADNYQALPYTSCPIPEYENLQLIDERIEASEENNQISHITRVYRGNLATSTFPSAPRAKYTGMFYPGTLPPERFIVSMVKHHEYRDILLPENVIVSDAASSYITPLVNAFDGGLLSVEGVPDGQTPATLGKKKVEWITEIEVQTLTGREYNDALENYINWTQVVLPRAEADALVAAAGTEISIQPVNSVWSVVTVESPTVGMSGTAFNSNASITYTSHHYDWPQVMTFLQWGFVPVRPGPGEEPIDGDDQANELYIHWEMKPAQSGLFKATRTVAFSISNPLSMMASLPVQRLITTGLRLNWPGVCNISIPECLHFHEYGGYTTTFSGTTGINHPVYGYVAYSHDWEPTLYGDWPTSVVSDYDVRKWKGGYLVTKLEIARPTN